MQKEGFVAPVAHHVCDIAFAVGHSLGLAPEVYQKDIVTTTIPVTGVYQGISITGFSIAFGLHGKSKLKDDYDMAARVVLLPFEKLPDMPTPVSVIFINSHKEVDEPFSVESYVPVYPNQELNGLNALAQSIIEFLRFGIVPRTTIATKINTNKNGKPNE